ncbi:uncharacterized protein LOC129720762 [Wyeomyia smithii]|uniref:uncharacterized protein LOC129720762 n=1 Tax=Wyeomyia smithii TaxID=174621 RepID=UPI002467B8BC|nr:uncharacterized protein LOC129720762 [Wyeomyia smithii]
MFNFMKKGVSGDDRDEKERRKKEKKLRKDSKSFGVPGSVSAEELLRLDEVRKSLKIRGRRKEKEKLPSGITADYSASFFAQLDIDREVEQDRGIEEVIAMANTTAYVDKNEENINRVIFTNANVSHSDSSETSMTSINFEKVCELQDFERLMRRKRKMNTYAIKYFSLSSETLLVAEIFDHTNPC